MLVIESMTGTKMKSAKRRGRQKGREKKRNKREKEGTEKLGKRSGVRHLHRNVASARV